MLTVVTDSTNGYGGLAREYAASRSGTIGVAAALAEAGHLVSGSDASPEMIRLFSDRFPAAPVECAPVETAPFFGRTFDGVLAWGLVFLLGEDAQRAAIRRMAGALRQGGVAVHGAGTANRMGGCIDGTSVGVAGEGGVCGGVGRGRISPHRRGHR